MNDYSDYQAAAGPGHNLKAALTEQATKQQELEADIFLLNDQLSAKQEELKEVRERTIPDLMDGLQGKLTLDDGRVVSIKETVRAHLSEANKPEGFKWLKEHEHEGIIKNELTIDLGKGREKELEEILEWLAEHYPMMATKVKKSVHAQTLGAFVRRQLEEGVDIPQKTFGVMRQRASKVEGIAKTDPPF